MEYKNFRSPHGDDIRVSSLSGHVATITSEFTPVPSSLWNEAYSLGAQSEDMNTSSMADFIELKKQEAIQEAAIERASIKEALRVAYDNPVSYVDKNNSVIHRKIIALLGKPIKKDLIDDLWNELAEEK